MAIDLTVAIDLEGLIKESLINCLVVIEGV
jgi:hypothetical protein